jgi:predicted nucleic acid-binding protein
VIILDASVLIAHFEAADPHHDRATQLLLNAGEEPLAAHPITVAELLVGPAVAGTTTTAQRALARLGLTTLSMQPEDVPLLADLRATSGCKMPDCCVLAAAIGQNPSAAIATFDERLTRAATTLGLTTLS